MGVRWEASARMHCGGRAWRGVPCRCCQVPPLHMARARMPTRHIVYALCERGWVVGRALSSCDMWCTVHPDMHTHTHARARAVVKSSIASIPSPVFWWWCVMAPPPAAPIQNSVYNTILSNFFFTRKRERIHISLRRIQIHSLDYFQQKKRKKIEDWKTSLDLKKRTNQRKVEK